MINRLRKRISSMTATLTTTATTLAATATAATSAKATAALSAAVMKGVSLNFGLLAFSSSLWGSLQPFLKRVTTPSKSSKLPICLRRHQSRSCNNPVLTPARATREPKKAVDVDRLDID